MAEVQREQTPAGTGTSRGAAGVSSPRAVWPETSRSASRPAPARRTAQTSPEELIAGAHAGCYAMALSLLRTQAGNPPDTSTPARS
jgi:organic hydroperoxide reductase OsmC/OhrA